MIKKYMLLLVCLVAAATAKAGDGDNYLNISGGYQWPNTLDATFSYERELPYGKAVEIFGEAGNHWQKPVCHMFWKGYYWDGGLNYKMPIRRYKNSNLRFRIGAYAGADRRKFFFGAEAGFEYNYIFPCGIQFSIIQKNNFNFLHAAMDHFRNGLLIGFKFPI